MNTTFNRIPPACDNTREEAVLVLRQQLRDLLDQCVEKGMFSERDNSIVQLRLALLDGEWHLLDDVARRVGIKRERVRQVQNLTLRRARCLTDIADLLEAYFQLAPPPIERHAKPPWLDENRGLVRIDRRNGPKREG